MKELERLSDGTWSPDPSNVERIANKLQEICKKALEQYPTKVKKTYGAPWHNESIAKLIATRNKKGLSKSKKARLTAEIKEKAREAREHWLEHQLDEKEQNGKKQDCKKLSDDKNTVAF